MKVISKIGKWLFYSLCIVLLIIFFFWFVHPLLTKVLIPPLSVHRQVEQYTSGQYKRYEDGELFAKFTESSGLLDRGEIVAFYHVNHWLQDNPIHGKQCDYFALDIQMTPEEYAMIKAEQLELRGKPYNERDYQVWAWSIGEEKNACWLGVCDDNNSVKLALVTGVHANDFIGTGFYLYSEIDWKSHKWTEE